MFVQRIKERFDTNEPIFTEEILMLFPEYSRAQIFRYIDKAKRQAEKQTKMEEKKIPSDIDYDQVKNLALEARQKLNKIRPLTIGQATRISGINPADISVLLIYLKQKYNEE